MTFEKSSRKYFPYWKVLAMVSDMDTTDARAALAQAQSLQTAGAAAGRWLVRYYVIFGLASFAFSSAFGFTPGRNEILALTAAWVVFVLVLSLYAGTRRAAMRGMGRVHAVVMTLWGLTWLIVVQVGAFARMGLWWWVGGGIVQLLICLAAARHVAAKTSSPA